MQGLDLNRPIFFNWSQLDLTVADTVTYINATTANTKANIMCVDVSTQASIRSTLKINPAVTTVSKMPGCGLAVLNTRYLNIAGATAFNNTIWGSDGTVAIASDTALICASCSPNFRPTYHTVTMFGKDDGTLDVNQSKNYFVTQCTAIANCTSSTNVMMNGCQKCDSGFAFLAKAETVVLMANTNAANQSIDRTYCVKLPENNLNCYAYAPTTSNTAATYDPIKTFPLYGKCVQCNKGYYLNNLGFCDKLTISGCNSGSFVQHFSNDFSMAAARLASGANQQNLKFIAFFSQYGISECNQC